MSVHATILAALEPVLQNTWAIELPPEPTFPAIVFDLDSKPEDAWCHGAGYDRHSLNVIAIAPNLQGALYLIPSGAGGPVRAALEALGPLYMFEEDSGDADYEPDARLYARFLTVQLRTPRTGA